MDVRDFLQKLGLLQYEAAFRDNGIDLRVLPKLTAEDLKDLGVNMIGHRRLLLDAIAALRNPPSAPVRTSPGCRTPEQPRPHCGTPPADGDVLRSRRLNRTVVAA